MLPFYSVPQKCKLSLVWVQSTGLQEKLCKCSFLNETQSSKMLEKLDKKFFFVKNEEETVMICDRLNRHPSAM